jgi:hypothetical protein
MSNLQLLDRFHTQVKNSECPDHIKAEIIVSHYKSLSYLVQSLSDTLEYRRKFGPSDPNNGLIKYLIALVNECSIEDFGKKLIDDEIKDGHY